MPLIDLEVWRHRRTGDYYLVEVAANAWVGPLPAWRVLREKRVYENETVGTPGVFESPYWWGRARSVGGLEPTDMDEQPDDSLPVGVTFYSWAPCSDSMRVDPASLEVDWMLRESERSFWIEAANQPEAWVRDDAVLGVLRRGWALHPKGSVIVTPEVRPGERLAILDLPTTRDC